MKLDQFLKFQGLAATGGQAKLLIQAGSVEVNGQIEYQRGRQLEVGDSITIGKQTVSVEAQDNQNMCPRDIEP